MRSYEVLVYSGRPRPPELHLVAVPDDETASDLADQFLFETPAAVGVEVTCTGQRLYVRGTVPVITGAPRRGPAARASKRTRRSGAALQASA